MPKEPAHTNHVHRHMSILALTLILTALATSPASAQATTNPNAIGIIDTQAILKAFPAGQHLLTLYQQRQDELQPLTQKLSNLQSKATTGNLTPQEQERLTLLQQTISATTKRWDTDINKAAGPVEATVNNAVAAIAEQRGITIVLDAAAARRTQLIVYAAPQTDITTAVEAAITNP